MAVHGAAPRKLGEINQRRLTPAFATWLFGIISCVWYVGLVAISENTNIQAYDSAIAAVGIMIAFYYGLTGYACVVYYWKYLFTSVKNFVLVGLLPLIGSLMLTFVLWTTLKDSISVDYEYGTIFGIGTVFFIGVSLLALGIPLMLWMMMKQPAFFNFRRDPVAMRPDPDGNGGPAPALGTYTKENADVR